MVKDIALRSICAFLRAARAGCVLGNSKLGAAATLLPHGQAEPTKASDLDIYNDNENDIDIAINSDNERDEKRRHRHRRQRQERRPWKRRKH